MLSPAASSSQAPGQLPHFLDWTSVIIRRRGQSRRRVACVLACFAAEALLLSKYPPAQQGYAIHPSLPGLSPPGSRYRHALLEGRDSTTFDSIFCP